jgi:diacylglycerol kinase (ATP)
MMTTTARRSVKSEVELDAEAGLDVSLPIGRPPMDLGRPIRMAVINNPGSGNNRRRRRLASILGVLKQSGVPHAEADTLEGFVTTTEELLDDGAELIVINGGDGTVQGVLTGLFRAAPRRHAPLVAVLPGGTTNTTARNVGYAARAEQALRELIAEAERGHLSGEVDERAVMRVERGRGSAPLFAMFFGAGAVYHGIRFCKDQVESRGMRGQLGAGVALSVFLGRIATGQGGKLFPPLHANVVVDGERHESQELLGMIASTMERQFLGLRPYWGREPGPIHYSSLAYSPRHLSRAAIPVMFGRPNRFGRPEFGYRSCNASHVELHLDSGFTLDGELYSSNPGTPVRLSAERTAFFLRREPG